MRNFESEIRCTKTKERTMNAAYYSRSLAYGLADISKGDTVIKQANLSVGYNLGLSWTYTCVLRVACHITPHDISRVKFILNSAYSHRLWIVSFRLPSIYQRHVTPVTEGDSWLSVSRSQFELKKKQAACLLQLLCISVISGIRSLKNRFCTEIIFFLDTCFYSIILNVLLFDRF